MALNRLEDMRASDADRAQVSQLLQAACAEGRLSLDEFSHRIERAIVARTHADLAELTRDLPTRQSQPAPPPAAEEAVILSDVHRRPWHIAEHTRMLVVLGSCKLDLRRAAMSPGTTVIETQVFAGSLDIIVPEDVWVDYEAITVMGSKSLKLGGPRPGTDASRLLIRGSVVAGSVTIRDVW